jgi:predicted metal-dependent hydrolase
LDNEHLFDDFIIDFRFTEIQHELFAIEQHRVLVEAQLPTLLESHRTKLRQEALEEYADEDELVIGEIIASVDVFKKWQRKLKVTVNGYFLQRMKTKWGGCNHKAGHIRLNTELVKKPKDLLEYVIVHEMAHLLEPKHNDRFIALLEKHYPTWRDARVELNELPLTAEMWRE